ncbi:MAG: DUF5408 family protein [Helicobacter sp.]|nr:DUF5408 family protein [Helicobacter sp.]
MENLKKEIIQNRQLASKAIKISLIACVITLVFATLSLWVLLNQITATANLTKELREIQEKISFYEPKILNPKIP